MNLGSRMAAQRAAKSGKKEYKTASGEIRVTPTQAALKKIQGLMWTNKPTPKKTVKNILGKAKKAKKRA